ncbi:hypothetical protein G4B88_021864 [Cannabis sativa]|uniref:DUF4283 domain-containing protein n=1 Tax=Cannabis sativa TaxID=3483 RepID=A0A7J6GZR3_CANSA|nr:hypothetical protein G4B88_021864 [Cannabis sativa]
MDPAQVSDLFHDAVQLSPEDITFALNPGEVDEPEEANQVLIGKIISRYRLGKAAIQGSLKLSWSAISGWKWKEIEGGLIQFTFAKREDAMNVLARRPWFVCGALIVIMPWPAWLTPAEIRFDKTPLWVKIESIPPFYWNLSNLKEMASRASPVYDLPPGIEDAIGMSSLRFRATIDLNKPIFSGFFLRRQKLKDLWIQYKYERLPKLCFKCGLLTHDQSICFKTPTVVKDGSGNFYPMYGIWLKSDAPERSTFTSPLAKWFQDWVLQKQIFLDPTLRNQLKVHKALRNGESADLRECRRQLPGKKRIVSDEDQPEASQDPLAITQLPLVNLPGIGEIAPFGNNTKEVSIQELQELRTVAAGTDGESSNGKPAVVRISEKSEASRTSPKPTWVRKRTPQASPHKLPHLGKHAIVVAQDEVLNASVEQKESENLKQPSEAFTLRVSPGHEAQNSSPALKPIIKDLPNYSSLLGSQATLMDWPSTDCWAQKKARELLMGGLTVDKYFREPTLLNPLMDINDFRVQEHLVGPRKRKASDGIIVKPAPEKQLLDPECDSFTTKANIPSVDSPPHSPGTTPQPSSETHHQPNVIGTFNSGSAEAPSSSKRRGRPRKCSMSTINNSCTPRKRGRPPKNKNGLSATPKTFKWRKSIVSMAGGPTTVQLQKDGGLGLCWNEDVKCEIDISSKYVISAAIDSEPKGFKWMLMGIYGPPHREDKEAFWINIGDMVNQSPRPVLLIGDMNGTLKDSECFHYANQGNSSRYAFDFRRMVNGVGLIDLGFQGPCYTWAKDRDSNNHGGSTKRARLDRGLASPDWRVMFPNAIVKHLSSMGSDHRPILLDSTGGANCKGRLFKYENMWARDPRCFWIVKETWAKRLHQNPMTNFYQKVKATGRMLQKWNFRQFRHWSKFLTQSLIITTTNNPRPKPITRDLDANVGSTEKVGGTALAFDWRN